MKASKFCTDCGARIGLLTEPPLCDSCREPELAVPLPSPEPERSPEHPARVVQLNIKGPCKFCGEFTKAESLADLFCSDPCREYHERRKAARDAKPGDDYYNPLNDVQRANHKSALRKRYRNRT